MINKPICAFCKFYTKLDIVLMDRFNLKKIHKTLSKIGLNDFVNLTMT